MPSKPRPAPPKAPADRSGRTPRRRAEDAAPGKAPKVPWPLRPLRWIQDLLRRPLRLERRGLQIHVTLAPHHSVHTETAAGTVSVVSRGEALREAHYELRALLDHHPKARRTMRHLAYLERTLSRHGHRALRHEVPVPVLVKCQQQLEVLAPKEHSAGLDELRHQLREAIGSRAHEQGFALSQPVHVSEASHSLFDEMERSWAGQAMPDKPAPR